MSATLEERKRRKAETTRIREKFPDRIPIWVDRAPKATTDTPTIDRNKYLVPHDLTVGQFMWVIRRRLHLKPNQTIYMFLGQHMAIAPHTHLMSMVAKEHTDAETGYLHVYYSFEDYFG